MNAQTIVQALLASLTFLPFAFVLAACWAEAISSFKKSPRHQPGVTALLCGAVGVSIANIVVANLLGAPVGVPAWGGILGIASLLVIAAAYGFRFYLKKVEPTLPPKKLRDLKMGHSLILAASALILFAVAITSTNVGAFGQLLGFLPFGLLAAVIFLEILSAVKSVEPYQPSIIAVLAATIGSVVTAIATAAVKLPASEITPIWLSPWGIGAAVFITFAYLSKVSARKKIVQGRDPQIVTLQTPAQRLKALSVKPSPAGYTFALLVALPLVSLAHLRFSADREGALAALSKTADSVKEFAQGVTPSVSTVDQYASQEGSIAAAMARPPAPETSPAPETPFDEGSSSEMEMVEPVEPLVMSGLPEEDMPPEPVAVVPEDAADSDDDIPEVAMTGVTSEEDTSEKAALNVSAIKPYDDGAYFVSKVEPILKSHCYDCHSSTKKKGGLQLHNAVSIRSGAESGSIIIAGNPERSPIYTTTTLDEDDPDVMPSKGDLLSKNEQAVLKKWILDGAHMDDGEIHSALATTGTSGNFLIDKQAAKIKPPNGSVIQALAQSGVVFRALSSNGALIKVDFSHTDRGRPALADLEAIAGNIYHLDLSRTKVTDDDLAIIAKYPILHNLELSHTEIGDTGVEHLANMKYLDSLNLYNTKVGSEGLKSLYGIKSLKKVFAFDSGISKDDAKSAEEQIAGLTVVID